MNITRTCFVLLLLAISFSSAPVYAQSSLAGLDTNGAIFTVNTRTGELTEKANEQLHAFSLGAITRADNILYYVAVPSGETEQAVFKASLKTGAISHVDLDLPLGDDSARALFIFNSKLYGVFFNSSAGTGGVYRINPRTGVTNQIVDFAALDTEPIGGAISRQGDFFYMLGHPSSDSSVRSLIRFKIRRNSASTFSVATKDGDPVVCDRLKLNLLRQDFVCLASPSETQVDVCRLSTRGRARCVSTLSGVKRIAGGHTLVTPNGRTYYAFVYAPDDEDSQRLIKFTGGGALKSTATIDSIIIGARFGVEGD